MFTGSYRFQSSRDGHRPLPLPFPSSPPIPTTVVVSVRPWLAQKKIDEEQASNQAVADEGYRAQVEADLHSVTDEVDRGSEAACARRAAVMR